ncbi:MAG: hypothetical protein WC360_05565 [Opitutales bacterium]|jgi:hypothetical protein
MKSRSQILRVQASGRCAELVVDTGHLLGSGRTWLAYAKVPCSNVYTASMLSENLGKRIGDAVAQARREAYNAGYRAARMGEAPHTYFDGTL